MRSGARPSFQRPASVFVNANVTCAGWSRPVLVALAAPLSAVAGAALLKAERSSAEVRTARSPSGQRANGRKVALAASDWAGRWVDGCALTLACNTGAASGPASVARARQAGRAAAAGAVGAVCASVAPAPVGGTAMS